MLTSASLLALRREPYNELFSITLEVLSKSLITKATVRRNPESFHCIAQILNLFVSINGAGLPFGRVSRHGRFIALKACFRRHFP
jgi:hypothetical protein